MCVLCAELVLNEIMNYCNLYYKICNIETHACVKKGAHQLKEEGVLVNKERKKCLVLSRCKPTPFVLGF